ncbi:unnamed protein product [Cuscuta campestris]|uniref:Uncharacterized protein n=1 Tax=Cuscuta campestris TaxID=132261 RepID=A0A484MS87_9ASTE|nr:unnamed protein product [Cuscuta campestris]
MDSQGEDQIWRAIKAALDDYATKVHWQGMTKAAVAAAVEGHLWRQKFKDINGGSIGRLQKWQGGDKGDSGGDRGDDHKSIH